MWKNLDEFNYKTMEYTYSCFPCSLHTIYANLGILSASGYDIEEKWGTMHPGGLNSSPPTFPQIFEYLEKSGAYRLAQNIRFFINDSFVNGHIGEILNSVGKMNTVERVSSDEMVVNIANQFVDESQGGAGMIIAGGRHAMLFCRIGNKTFYYSPQQDEKQAEIWCCRAEIIEAREIIDGKCIIDIDAMNIDEQNEKLGYTTEFVMLIY